jgi:hypothetical protein
VVACFVEKAIGSESSLIYHKNYFVREHRILCSEFCSWQRNLSCSWLHPSAHLEGVVTEVYVLETMSQCCMFSFQTSYFFKGNKCFLHKGCPCLPLGCSDFSLPFGYRVAGDFPGSQRGLTLAVRTEQTILAETRAESVYRLHHPGHQLCFSFLCQRRYDIKH